MENLATLIGKRVNVDLIRTENWQSEKYVHNGIVDRITEYGQVVVYMDENSTHSFNCTGGYFYPSAFNITVLNDMTEYILSTQKIYDIKPATQTKSK